MPQAQLSRFPLRSQPAAEAHCLVRRTLAAAGLAVLRLASSSPRNAAAHAVASPLSGGAPTAATWANAVPRFKALVLRAAGFEVIEGYAAAPAKLNSLFRARNVCHIVDAAASFAQVAPVS